MPKVYAIIRGNGNILVGSGGKSGKSKATRTGLHLPGGSCDAGETAKAAALREIREETGISLLEQDYIDSFTLKLNGVDVTFVVFEVVNVDTEIANRKKPPIVNEYDEPFAALSSLAFADCVNNPGFSAAHGTDWFGIGLKYARDNKML